jgi:CSLREA domain-containing protein
MSMNRTETIMEMERSAGRTRKYLAAGFLVVAMLAGGLAPAVPADASTTFTVTSTADTGDDTPDGTCDQCTLREAIQEANALPEADTIEFNIPGTGVKSIAVDSTGLGPLPSIKQQVTIDGYTQPGAHPNTRAAGNDAVLRVELDGSGVVGSGLEIIGGSSNNLIRGLVINRFTGVAGVNIHGTSVGNRVEGNFIGTDVTGTLDRGNEGDGVSVFAGSEDVVIGGTTPASRNVISGNDERGVEIQDTTFTRVLGNRIGTTAGGQGKLGNRLAGVAITGSEDANHEIGDGSPGGSNLIAFNGADGVNISSGVRHTVSRNFIFNNAGLGIDLAGGAENRAGATANDPGDRDSGPNHLQNKPVLTAAGTVSGKTTVKGKLNSTANTSYMVQFFSNPSGTNEGKNFVGQKLVTTDASGNTTFTLKPTSKIPAGRTITATARVTSLSLSFGDTSEFSTPRTVKTL